MDPSATLVALRANAARVDDIIDHADDEGYTDAELAELADLASELAEQVNALDSWLQGGGHLPASWQR